MDKAVREGKGRTGLKNYCSLKTQTQKLSDYSQIHCLKNNSGFISFFVLCFGTSCGHES